MATVLTQVTITSTATLIYTSSGATTIYIHQVNAKGPGVVRIGDATVTPGTGLPISTFPTGVPVPTGDSVYGITEPGTTAIVNVMAIT